MIISQLELGPPVVNYESYAHLEGYIRWHITYTSMTEKEIKTIYENH